MRPDDQMMYDPAQQVEQWAYESPVVMEDNPREPSLQVVRSIKDKIEGRHAMQNIAEDLEQFVIDEIAAKVVDGYTIDLESRADWAADNKEVMDLVRLVVKEKRYAGEIVANVKYPLILNACIQFAARAYPEIVKGNDVVKPKVIGMDPDGIKKARAKRVCDHMSYQLLNEMPDWEDGVDQLLFTLPAVGSVFKKTYHSCGKNISEVVFAEDLVVNYNADCLERAPRVTHVIELYQNEIVERINSGAFLDFDVETLGKPVNDGYAEADEDVPHVFIEQHRWYDLDEDGYKEPYIVTVHLSTQKLVRIAPRYELDGIEFNDAGEVVSIKPVHYFTRFLFMPAIDAGFYGMGFGILLQSINSAANTAINQLLDAGTLSNRQPGFLGRGLRLGTGKSITLKSGEWKPVDATGDDLRKNIFPVPVREPSATLYNLLNLLIDVGKELSGITEVLSGHSPGSNVPAETTLALIEQGLQVYSAIHKRIHRSLYREYQKIRRLNRLYLDDMEYQAVLDDPQAVKAVDYASEDMDIIPVSDPNSTTLMQRVMKAKAMLELRGQGLNDTEILRRYLEALQVENIEALLPDENQEDPRAGLELQAMQTEIQKMGEEIRKLGMEAELLAEKINTERVMQQVRINGAEFDRQKLNIEKARTLNQIQTSAKMQEQGNSEFKGKSAETSAQGPYREKGMESNNEGSPSDE